MERVKVVLKEKVLVKRGRSQLRLWVPLKVRILRRVGRRYFPGPATLPEAWRERKPEELIMSGPVDENPGRATMAFKQGPNGIPIFERPWLVSDAPVRATRVLENQGRRSQVMGSHRHGLLVSMSSRLSLVKVNSTSLSRHCHQGKIQGVDCVPQHEPVSLYPVVGASHGCTGDVPTQLKVR